jgi:hypothetical protein
MNSDSKHKSNAPAPELPAPATPAPATPAPATPAPVPAGPVPAAPPSPPSVPASTDAEYNNERVAKMFKKTDDDASITTDAMLTPAPVGNVAAASKIAPVRSEYSSSPSASTLSPHVSTRKKRRKVEKAADADDDAFFTPGAMLTPAAVGNVAAASKIAPVRSNFPSFMRQI